VSEVKVAVVGAGAWGTTLATLVSGRADTWLWAREAEVVEAIRCRRANPLFLDGYALPSALQATGVLRDALDGADVVIVAVPAQHVRDVLGPEAGSMQPGATILIATKGIEVTTLRRMSEVVAEVLPAHDRTAIGCVSGPNLAREVMAGQPTATCVAFADPARAVAARDLLMSDTLRVYTSEDVVGCEVGGAAKNVIAIAAGVADGLGYGMNTKASLVARGLAELTRLGVALGGEALTFLGLAGIGDLVATCASPLSRNRSLGEALGRGQTLEAALAASPSLPEGVPTATALIAIADDVGIELPIATTVAGLLRNEMSVGDLVTRLMLRPARRELHGLDPHEEERPTCTR
jgi:glycerol-3-phosphate dehydrogenase (NAD(P)+)